MISEELLLVSTINNQVSGLCLNKLPGWLITAVDKQCDILFNNNYINIIEKYGDEYQRRYENQLLKYLNT